MRLRYLIYLKLILFALIAGCNQANLGPVPFPEDYHENMEAWQADRLESLTNPTGWMRLSGMYWLKEGVHSFGSDMTMDVRFPEGTIPTHAGTFIVDDGTVRMDVEEEVNILHDEKPVQSLMLYDGSEAPHVEYQNLEWLVIDRNGLLGIRLYNKENEKVDMFTGFDRYPTDQKWHVRARFLPNPEGTTLSVLNVLGQSVETSSPGALEFLIDDETYTLDTLEGSTRLFIIIGDQTNQTETYQAGRYLYVDYPNEDGYTIIDFNKAYNPPCAFSKFTTCQLPPPQNRLDVAITAGEKRPVEWEGL